MLYETSHLRASDAHPCDSVHMICFFWELFFPSCAVAKREYKTRRQYGETVVTILFATHGFVTFENEVWCVQTPGAFLHKSTIILFCFQYTSNEIFYHPCNFHFNILSSFEIIAKTLYISVTLEVSLSIVFTFLLKRDLYHIC